MHFTMHVKGQFYFSILITCTGSHVNLITAYKRGRDAIMATCAGSPQTAIRARGNNKCSKHHGKDVVFYCRNCDNLSCADCAIQECQGHVFEGISNVIPASKQKLQDFIAKAEQTDIPGIQGKLQAADNDLAKNKTHFKNKIRHIRKQNEALKKELDKLTDTFVRIYQGMEQQNSEELLTYKRDQQTRIDQLTSQLQDVKGALQSGNDILVFDMSHVNKSELNDLPQPVCSTPEFTPGKLSVQALEQLLGKINTAIQNKSLNQTGKWKVKSKFTPYTGHWIKSIHAAAAGDQVWLSFFISTKTVEKMLLTDQSGQVKQTLDMDVRVTNFCVSPNTGDIWFCSAQDNSVREVKAGRSTVRFTTDTIPWSICVTKDDHVVIAHDTEVVKYTQRGQVVCRTSRTNKPVLRTPRRLSECPLTSNLAVVDKDKKVDGGNDERFVSILNDQLEPLFTYTGGLQGQQSPTKPFDPYDVCFTVTGELVITDWDNKSVVLVTGTGGYISTLYTDSESSPGAVCVHNGALWVSLDVQSVKVLKDI